jgi:Gas vesicle protein
MPQIVHTTDGSNLADVVERLLDKGVVIAGDIRIRLVEVDLLTINIRLLISSVDKAREIGVDWWTRSSFLTGRTAAPLPAAEPRVDLELQELRSRLERLERSSA